MRLSKFVRFQELRVAGRGPWTGVGGLGSRTGYHGSRPWESLYVLGERAEATRGRFNLFNPRLTGRSHTFPSGILFGR